MQRNYIIAVYKVLVIRLQILTFKNVQNLGRLTPSRTRVAVPYRSTQAVKRELFHLKKYLHMCW